jgi:hypothetical protein
MLTCGAKIGTNCCINKSAYQPQRTQHNPDNGERALRSAPKPTHSQHNPNDGDRSAANGDAPRNQRDNPQHKDAIASFRPTSSISSNLQ